MKKFKLSTTLSCGNYVLFDGKGQIKKYASEADIFKEWFGLRTDLYIKRKEQLFAKLKKDLEILRNKARFVECVINETIKIKKVSKNEILKQLKNQQFMTKT